MATSKNGAKPADESSTKKTTTRRTTKKKLEATPVAEKVAQVETITEVMPEPVVEPTPAPAPAPALAKRPVRGMQYAPDELIPCRSVNAGELVYIGPKTRIPYDWAASGDIVYMEYQDVLAAVVSRSKYVFKPWFIIEDETLLDDPRWSEVKRLYDSMYDLGDAREIVDLPVREFEERFIKLPIGMKNAVKSEIATRIADGTFDSIQKVRIVDEVCKTDLALMIG